MHDRTRPGRLLGANSSVGTLQLGFSAWPEKGLVDSP
jgi:hypothetical protein